MNPHSIILTRYNLLDQIECIGQDLEEDVLLDRVKRGRVELDPALHRVDDGGDHPVLFDRRQRRGPLELAHQWKVLVLKHQQLIIELSGKA